ncbi:MAG: M48 family metallopeptidase [Epsilonproteobacteria bacterium]|nr:M48 family metallopeptidase [Campylobacterota bacterium]
MLLTIGAIFFIYILTKVYISVMEVGYVSDAKNDKAVILTPTNYLKAANYKIASQRVEILSALIEYLVFIFWIGFGLKWLESMIVVEDMAFKSVLFILGFGIIGFFFSLPFSIYQTFFLDKKFGFSNMDAKLFITDTLKSSVMFILFGGGITWLISKIIIHVEDWWLWGFALIFAIMIVINVIYPTLIAPIFNKFTILENEELKESIEKLLDSVGLKTDGVFTIDASKRDNRLNAYFGGLGKSKRVVLFDTLIEKLSKNELLAVLGHELGHFKHKDIIKNIFMMGVLLFLMFFIFGNLPISLFEVIGIEKTPYAIIAMFLIFSPIISLFFMPIFGMVSRRNEYHADEFGAECESKEELASALQKLANENKSFPKSHPLYIFFYHTHPPLVERLKRLGVKIDG